MNLLVDGDDEVGHRNDEVVARMAGLVHPNVV